MKSFTCNVCGKKAEKSYFVYIYDPEYKEIYVTIEDDAEGDDVHLCLDCLIKALKEKR